MGIGLQPGSRFSALAEKFADIHTIRIFACRCVALVADEMVPGLRSPDDYRWLWLFIRVCHHVSHLSLPDVDNADTCESRSVTRTAEC